MPAAKPASDEALRQAVAEFRGTRRELATHLGMSERTLYRRLKELGLA
jgi:DNA-binding NtrC family response regulator